jgi:hypothetical protein
LLYCIVILYSILLFIYSNITLCSYFSILIPGTYYSPPRLDEIISSIGFQDYLKSYGDPIEYFDDFVGW